MHEITNGKPSSFVIVPGFIKSYGQTKQGLKITDVVPIEDKKIKTDLTTIIQKDSKGHVNFW